MTFVSKKVEKCRQIAIYSALKYYAIILLPLNAFDDSFFFHQDMEKSFQLIKLLENA